MEICSKESVCVVCASLNGVLAGSVEKFEMEGLEGNFCVDFSSKSTLSKSPSCSQISSSVGCIRSVNDSMAEGPVAVSSRPPRREKRDREMGSRASGGRQGDRGLQKREKTVKNGPVFLNLGGSIYIKKISNLLEILQEM
jgi:hypothetical protein